MKRSDGRERLPISAVKQYAYCKRRFALMFIDGEWGDNYKITEGDIFHEKVNDPFFNEKRGDRYLSRSIPVFSDRLNLYGIVDIVEFLSDGGGVDIGVKPGLWRINPIEYKNGKPEKSGADNLQLCAQALCLEEMFSTVINSGDIYYGKLRKRVTIPLTDSLKQKTEAIVHEINSLLTSEYPQVPSRPEDQNCCLCSLVDICIPSIFDTKESNSSRMGKLLETRR
jgi:CRISPR-associated exonuclease Cas4